MEQRAEYAERTREEEARRRVDEERLRIAREVHDTVAHSIATINVQAGVAAHVVDKRPGQALDALLAIKQTSGEVLQELRATVGMLRNADDGSRAPAPRLGQLDRLTAMAHEAGLDVDVAVHGESRTLPSAVDLAAYRILQESITNVIRHAESERVTISLTYSPTEIEVQVVDDGRGPLSGNGQDAGGHGIAGMRERATLLGGRFAAGPAPSGGFRVWAILPAGK